MTIPERIYAFLKRIAPKAICDDCLAKEAGVSQRQTVNTVASTLALTAEFDRRNGDCSICKNQKLVTRKS
jgi:hypothetical protein